MKTYTLTTAAAFSHTPEHPERTAKQYSARLNFDVIFKVWPSRGALAKTIRMQQQRERRTGDWTACVPLTDGEGY